MKSNHNFFEDIFISSKDMAQTANGCITFYNTGSLITTRRTKIAKSKLI